MDLILNPLAIILFKTICWLILYTWSSLRPSILNFVQKVFKKWTERWWGVSRGTAKLYALNIRLLWLLNSILNQPQSNTKASPKNHPICSLRTETYGNKFKRGNQYPWKIYFDVIKIHVFSKSWNLSQNKNGNHIFY